MDIVADLHLHSKYSRAVSPRMTIPQIAEWGRKKGVNLLATSDWTHPLWFQELKANLEEVEAGVYQAKAVVDSPLFVLGTEIASIYSQGGKGRRIHNLVFAPNLETVEKINAEFSRRGFNLLADGRPILGLSSRDLVNLVMNVDEHCLVIPAHCWTPWFSLYGSKSGFDSLAECFQDMSQSIYAVETGLSSDPSMNWRIKDLDQRRIVSFGDSHSPEKIGREATIFKVKSPAKGEARQGWQKEKGKSFNYLDLVGAMKGDGDWRVAYTIEFYPEEGKYHYTGHRQCRVCQSPSETKKLGTTCPVCGRPLTVGVMHRVEQLAQREVKSQKAKGKSGLTWITGENRPPYVMLVPLMEILAESFQTVFSSQRVKDEYQKLIEKFGSEFNVLLQTKPEEISAVAGEKVAEAIQRVRAGELVIEPGYDGVFGKVKIWPAAVLAKNGSSVNPPTGEPTNKQMSLL